MSLDKIDRAILAILQKAAKTTNAQLADMVGLSPAATLERVRKLENAGIIQGYHARLDTDKIGLKRHMLLYIKIQPLEQAVVAAFLQTIASMPEVICAYQITGDADFLLQVVTVDGVAYQYFLTEKLGKIAGAHLVRSEAILAVTKETAPLPLPVLPQTPLP